MTRFRHGLVIGKFYPPHSGHEFLIRTAAEQSNHVTVVVMAASAESIALELRVQWLRAIFREHPNVTIVGVTDNEPVDYHSAHAWEVHIAHMREGLQLAERMRSPAGLVDAVFTSEDYGEEMATRFGAVSVCVDRDRTHFPVSGTAVRSNPAEHWHHLAPCVREYLCLRVIIVGAESTGKTTLASALSEALRQLGGVFSRTQWVEEYGREYTAGKFAEAKHLDPRCTLENLVWTSEEFEAIAREQQRRENAAAQASGPILICDTDVFATEIWHERYIGKAASVIADIVRTTSSRRLYLLTNWREVPFEQDGLRDGERIREWMHDRFEVALRSQSAPWSTISGSPEQRVRAAMQWIVSRLSGPALDSAHAVHGASGRSHQP